MQAAKPFFWRRLKEVSFFFQKKDEVHKTIRRLVKRLDKAGIAYAVMGGMACNAHKYERTTKDVDILLTSEGLESFRRQFVPQNYEPIHGRPRRFTDKANQVLVDFLVAG